VSALFEGIGSGAVSTTYGDVVNAEVAIVTGSNAPANHPVASSFFKQARRKGTTIIYVDPRADKMADHADIYCQLKPGTDVAFYNGVMHEIIRLGLTDDAFIATRTSNYEALRRTVADYPPERAEQITGVPADQIRRVAQVWGEARAGVIYWGMGISQHTTGTDNALPDRAVRHHRERRQAGRRAAPAARAEQRAGRLRHGPDPDVLPGLPEGRRSKRHSEIRTGLGGYRA
jgi:formate dehydrogenase major subunit